MAHPSGNKADGRETPGAGKNEKALTEEQRRLATENHGLVSGCLRLHGFTGTEHDDLYGVAALGLCKAAREWDPSKGKFQSFAYTVMWNEMKNYFKHADTDMMRHLSDWDDQGERDESLEGGIPDRTPLGNPEGWVLMKEALRGLYDGLTPKKQYALRMLVSGYTEKEIHHLTGISEFTISAVRKELKAFLGRAR